jgi:hypothetical protein
MQITDNDFLKPKPQRGSASLSVFLRGGRLTVYSNNKGEPVELLVKRDCYEGDWNRIWEALENSIHEYEIPSADPARRAYYGEDD